MASHTACFEVANFPDLPGGCKETRALYEEYATSEDGNGSVHPPHGDLSAKATFEPLLRNNLK